MNICFYPEQGIYTASLLFFTPTLKKKNISLHTHCEEYTAFMNMHIYIYQTLATGHYFFFDSTVEFKSEG